MNFFHGKKTDSRHLPRNMAAGVILLLLTGAGLDAAAEVVGLQIDSRQEITGQKYNPAVGSYEMITGLIHLEVDPEDPANGRITDLRRAPRNADGRVEFSTEFYLLKPVDLAGGNDRLLYYVCNRGRKGGEGIFSAELDYSWLCDRGYSWLSCGWACDVIESDQKLNIRVPYATENGQPIAGRVHAELINHQNAPRPSQILTWGGSIPHPTASLDNAGAELSRRRYPGDTPEVVPHGGWSFARVQDGRVIPDPRHLHVHDGIQPGWLYEVVYTAQHPPLTGLGLAAIRDVVSYFRYGNTEEAGRDNPLAGHVEHVYSSGHSQSGRLLNHFVWQGFNSDEAGRIVFDGVIPSCPGGGKGQFNSRFAQTTRHGSHLEDNFYPVDFFPFAFEEQTDPVTRETGDTLALARELGNVPKMMILNSATDYWTRGASLLHTDVKGTRDAGIDPAVRIYSVAGIAHTEDRLGVIGRALLTAMDQWVSRGVEPPASRIPRIGDGTLVNLAAVRRIFPQVPDLRLPDSLYHPFRLDPGPRWKTEGIANFTPPKPGPRFVSLVPQVDADGNEIAGIRLPEIEVPLATFCGWSLRRPEYSNSMRRNSGQVWPLAVDVESRAAAGDGRPAIAERYATPEDYLVRVEASLARLLADRLILPFDHDRMSVLAGKQAALIGQLRPIDSVVVECRPEEAHSYFEKLHQAGLEWYYGGRGRIGAAINAKGYELMAQKRMETAEKVFRLNTVLYPDTGNVWDSLAECLFDQGRFVESRAHYQKVLELNPGNSNAAAMLERIAGAAPE